MIIRVKNTLDSNALYTLTSNAIASGASTIPVRNIASFQPYWAIQFGKTGEEKSEIKNITSATPSGTALLVSGTVLYDHPTDTPVYGVKFDQIVFKRSTTGTAGTATAMTNGTVYITPDSEFTQFDDTTGISTYAYKVSYRNSADGQVSGDSDWLTSSGYSFYSLFKIRERIRNKLFSIGQMKTGEEQINDWVNEWLETMNNVAVDVNQDYNLGTVDVAHGTNGYATITSTDFKDVRRVWYTTNGSDYYNARKIHITDFTPTEAFNDTAPSYYFIGDNVVAKKPDGDAGTARITYYRLGTTLTSDTDEIPVVMRGYTKSFVDYGVCQAYYFDDKSAQGDRFMNYASTDLEKFRTEITPRSKSGPTYITFTDPVTADEMDEYIY